MSMVEISTKYAGIFATSNMKYWNISEGYPQMLAKFDSGGVTKSSMDELCYM